MAGVLASPSPEQRGFTLIELMVTVSVVAILSAIAVPSYQDFRKRAEEAEAISYMRSWPAAQELYLQKYGRYADADENLAQAELGVLFVPDDIPYNFSIDSNNRQTERWYGRGTPTKAGYSHFFVDHTGIVLRSGSRIDSPG